MLYPHNQSHTVELHVSLTWRFSKFNTSYSMSEHWSWARWKEDIHCVLSNSLFYDHQRGYLIFFLHFGELMIFSSLYIYFHVTVKTCDLNWIYLNILEVPWFITSNFFMSVIKNKRGDIKFKKILSYKKQSHYRPGEALRFPGDRDSQFSRKSAREGS